MGRDPRVDVDVGVSRLPSFTPVSSDAVLHIVLHQDALVLLPAGKALQLSTRRYTVALNC